MVAGLIIVNETLDWQERGLHYGDGLFETLLKCNGKIPLWKYHYQRLNDGCRRLQIELPNKQWLTEKITRETQAMDTAVIKIIVTRGNGGRGLKLLEQNRPSIYVFNYPYTRLSDSQLALDVAICETRLPVNPNLAGIKHLNRLDYVLASLELQARGHWDEGILCDTDGFLIEGIISNLFFCVHNQWYTPSLEFTGVEGIMRRQILKHFESREMSVETGRFTPKLLMKTSECFMCNSVWGVRPVKTLNQAQLETGDLTQDMIKIFNQEQ